MTNEGWICCDCHHINAHKFLSCQGCEKPRWWQLGWTDVEKCGMERIRALVVSIYFNVEVGDARG